MTITDLIGMLVPILLAGMILVYLRAKRQRWRVIRSPRLIATSTLGGLVAINCSIALASLALAGLIWLGVPALVLAAPVLQNSPVGNDGVAVGAALATGMAAIGAGIAVGIAGAAAIGAITEKPESLGRVLIFVGLGEGIAIYGLIISFMILTR